MKSSVIFILFLGVVNFVTASNKAADEKIITAYYSKLKSTIQSEKSLVLEKFVTRDDRIAGRISVEICNLFERTTSISEKCRALYVLGVIKHPASIRTLVKNIDFYRPLSLDSKSKDIILITEVPLIARRPAKQALVAIGPRSIPRVTKEFLTTENTMKRRLCLDTLWEIFLKGLPNKEAIIVVRLIVENKIEKSSSSNKQLLLKELNNYISGKTSIIIVSSTKKKQNGN